MFKTFTCLRRGCCWEIATDVDGCCWGRWFRFRFQRQRTQLIVASSRDKCSLIAETQTKSRVGFARDADLFRGQHTSKTEWDTGESSEPGSERDSRERSWCSASPRYATRTPTAVFFFTSRSLSVFRHRNRTPRIHLVGSCATYVLQAGTQRQHHSVSLMEKALFPGFRHFLARLFLCVSDSEWIYSQK